jgi:cytidylate kinase
MKILNYHKYKYSDKGSIFLDIAKEEKIDVGGFSERYFEMSVAAIILLDRKQK